METHSTGPQITTVPMSQAQRNELIRKYYEADEAFVRRAQQDADDPEVPRLRKLSKRLLAEYFARLPQVTLSRCPFCRELLVRRFDPWGLEGFWWQHKMRVRLTEPTNCAHFAVLLGAMNLNGLPPKGGRAPAYPGPEVPYVIPRVLELPSMVAVVSTFEMGNGYRAHPIAYFWEKPGDPALLTQGWAERTFSFKLPEGRNVWTIRTDPWDFDLLPWVEAGKLKWIAPGDSNLNLATGKWSNFPYRQIPGSRKPQVIEDERVTYKPPPRGEIPMPFE